MYVDNSFKVCDKPVFENSVVVNTAFNGSEMS